MYPILLLDASSQTEFSDLSYHNQFISNGILFVNLFFDEIASHHKPSTYHVLGSHEAMNTIVPHRIKREPISDRVHFRNQFCNIREMQGPETEKKNLHLSKKVLAMSIRFLPLYSKRLFALKGWMFMNLFLWTCDKPKLPRWKLVMQDMNWSLDLWVLCSNDSKLSFQLPYKEGLGVISQQQGEKLKQPQFLPKQEEHTQRT